MAAAKKGSRSGSTQSRTTRTNSRSKKPKISLFGSLVELMTMTFFGRVILFLLVSAVLVGINLLVAKDRLDVFYFICGIELLAAILIGWIKMLVRPDA